MKNPGFSIFFFSNYYYLVLILVGDKCADAAEKGGYDKKRQNYSGGDLK